MTSGLEFAGNYHRLHRLHLISSAASISPISIRKPRSFTWKSARPEKLQISIRQETRDVAGAIHPVSQPERIAKKPFGGPIRSPPVPAHHAMAADIQIASLARGHRLKPGVQHVDLRVRDGFPQIGMRSESPVIRNVVDQIVVSVGPYMLCISPRNSWRS